MLRILAAIAVVISGAVAASAPASAQNYPDKPIRIIVPFAPGGGASPVARLLAEFLSQRLGQNAIVENKPGAGSAVGLDYVAKSKPDGYTLILASSDGTSILPAVNSNLSYKIPDDFSFIAGVLTYAQAIAVHPSLPVNTMAELIAFGKANPGKLRFASTGVGSGSHLAGALVGNAAGITMVHVPYPGAGPAVTGALGGFVDMVIVTTSAIKPHADSGKLRALATTDMERHPQLPDVPTLQESGLPGLVINGRYGLLAPPGTPEPILAKLRKEVADAVKDPKFIEFAHSVGLEPDYLPGDEYRDAMVKDLKRWTGVAKGADISIKE